MKYLEHVGCKKPENVGLGIITKGETAKEETSVERTKKWKCEMRSKIFSDDK